MMKNWQGLVTWYTKLITAALFVGLYLFGVYVGQQYATAVTPTPAIVYLSKNTKPEPLFPLLKMTTIFQVPAANAAGKKNTSTSAAAVVSKSPLTAPGAIPATPTAPTTVIPLQTIAPPPPVITQATTTPQVPAVTPPPTPPPATTPPPITPPPASGETRFTGYTTGYGWPDNTPPSAEISDGVLHQLAGGTGTYADPITVAVGHTILGNNDILDYSKGTIFYIPNLRRYFIVEDTCGDGNTPQNGPCHTGYQGHVWLDLWVGGTGSNSSPVLSCEDAITDLHLVIQNPASTYAVVPGPVYGSSCSAQFGDTVISS